MKTIAAMLLALTIAAPNAVCNSDNREACSRYALNALKTAFSGDLTDTQVLSIVYSLELGLFANSDASWEALVRSYSDKQSGAAVSISGWLATMQAVIDSVDSEGDVNLKRLLCCYEKYMDNAAWALGHEDWRTGQGVGVASVWGNFALAPGSTTIAHEGVYASIIVHTHADGKYTFDDDLGDGAIVCSLASVIVDVSNRLSVSTC